jgi:serine/threonine protein kinase
LSKEISESLAVGDGTYKLTGDTGTPRYMAPEVALEKPYNMTCDVVSFKCTTKLFKSLFSNTLSLFSIHLLSCCGICLHWRSPFMGI